MPKKREAKPLFLKNQTQKRQDRAQELRSARRQGVLAKRRKLDVAQTPGEAEQAESWSLEQLATVIQGVRVSPMSQILPFLVDLRKMLSLEDPPVEQVVEGGGLAPRLVELLRTPNDEIQIEAAWCVCPDSVCRDLNNRQGAREPAEKSKHYDRHRDCVCCCCMP